MEHIPAKYMVDRDGRVPTAAPSVPAKSTDPLSVYTETTRHYLDLRERLRAAEGQVAQLRRDLVTAETAMAAARARLDQFLALPAVPEPPAAI